MDVFLPEIALLQSSASWWTPSAKSNGGGNCTLRFSERPGRSLYALDFPEMTGKTAKRRADTEILLVSGGRFR